MQEAWLGMQRKKARPTGVHSIILEEKRLVINDFSQHHWTTFFVEKK
jgi:hypothetical protein